LLARLAALPEKLGLHPFSMRISPASATGISHIGKLLWHDASAIEWQDRGEAFYFIADYHALTTLHDAPLALRKYSRGWRWTFPGVRAGPGEGRPLFRNRTCTGSGN